MTEYVMRDGVAWITLDRPEKLNAIDQAEWASLSDDLERAGEEARVAVITGAGEAFCAGDDIADLASLEVGEDFDEQAALVSTVYQIEETPVPVIAAVDGPALGGGCEIVVACDLAIATEDAEFGLPEPRIGGISPVAAERVAVIGGRKRVMELLMLGEPVDAETALDWGLVNRVVPDDELESTVAEFVDLIRLSPKRPLRIAKEYTNATIRNGRERERMASTMTRLYSSEVSKEGVRAFVENREPEWRTDG